MTTYRYSGYWFERDSFGAVTAWGVAQCDFVMRDADTTLRYDPGTGGAPGTWVPQPLNIRLDGQQITDGTSNTLFAGEFAFGDGSVRTVTGGLRVDGMPNGRTYVFSMGDDLPSLPTLGDAGAFFGDLTDGAVRSLTGAVREGVPFPLTDGTSNTIFIGEADVLDGTGGRDVWNAGASDDQVHGWAGGDRLSGAAGNDTLWGDGGSDTLYGGTGADQLYGGAWHDLLFGDGGKDSLFGGSGNDDLFGGGGADRLWGGDGDDILDGGAGNDTLNGGAGAGAFLFAVGSGRDRIVDFRVAEGDVLQISAALAGGAATGAAVLAAYGIRDTEGYRLDFGGGTSVLLEGIEPDTSAALTALAAAIVIF